MQRKNYDKIMYIRQYANLRKRERELQRELADIQVEYNTLQAITYNDAPASPDNAHDLSAFIIRKDKQISEALYQINRIIDSYQEIERAVRRVTDLEEQDILRLKHMKRYDWKRVAKEMGYSVRQAQRVHGRALEHFEIPGGKDGRMS